ncbi:MAG: N-6 DNA methylase [Halobacteriovoraceae bacterium]|nr:N-6 DNA methylase [Halobacteriovoraceae bacterium]
MKTIPLTRPQTFDDIDAEVIPYTFHKNRHLHIDKDSNLISDFYLLSDLILKNYREFFLTGKCDENSIEGYEQFKEEFRSFIEEDSHVMTQALKEQNVIGLVIKPLLKCLGWDKYKISDEDLLGVFPRYSAEEICFNGDKADLMLCRLPGNAQEISKLDQAKNKDKGKKLLSKIESDVVTILEAKTLKSLGKKGVKNAKNDKDIEGKSASSQGPERQLIQYLNTYNKKLGILTDGRNWHLFYRDLSDSEIVRSFKFDLFQLADISQQVLEEENEVQFEVFARIFYFFFSKETHIKDPDTSTSILDNVFDDCDKYADLMDKALKPKFLQAMGLLTNSIKRSYKGNKKATKKDIELIRASSESLLFQLIFIKSCEMNGILPMEQEPYEAISLKSTIECLFNFSPKNLLSKESSYGELEKLKSNFKHKMKFTFEGNDIHKDIIKLINKINNDMTSLKIESFVETCFEKHEFDFLKKYPISNKDFCEILFCLGYFEKDGLVKEIPYNYLTPRQLGEIYETFLDFKLTEADENYWWNNKNKQWNCLKRWTDNYDSSKEIRIKQGELFFTPDNRDKKVAGSFYTPHDIVKYIVKNSLEPILENLEDHKSILGLSVCDPAMGSGHFLNYTLHFLTKKYREKYFEEFKTPIEEHYNESSRAVLDACIYGVDINESAVKLAKMSLWLSTAHRGRKLEKLEDQLKSGDSLLDTKFSWKKNFKDVFKKGGFNCIVQNPPYIFARDKKITSDDKKHFESSFDWASYQSNTYTLFIQRAWDLLNDNGILGAIIPNNWLTIDTCKTFREGYLAHFESHIIINSKDKIFENASVDNSIVISRKTPCTNKEITAQLFELSGGKFNHISEFKSSNYKGEPIVINSDCTLSEEHFQILENSKKLEDIADVKAGLQAYEVGKGTPIQTKQMKDDRIYHSNKRESSAYFPYLQGKDVCRYYVQEPCEYIKYGKNLASPRSKSLFEGPRVLVRQIPSKPPRSICAAIIDNDFLNDRNSMIIKPKDTDDAYYITAILNSEIITNWFILKFDKFQRKTFPQFKIKELKEFPIPSASKADRNRVIKLSKELSDLYKKEQLDKIEQKEAQLESLINNLFFSSSTAEEAA